MWINIIDYRGDGTTVNSRGDNLFDYRTKYFLRQQKDFDLWKKWGHKFRCFTQHNDNNFSKFDSVVSIPRSTAPQARNYVHDYYPQNTWIGLWDNDATLYWKKLNSQSVPQQLDAITEICEQQDIHAWVPFNAQQSPYPKTVPKDWSFKPTIQLKGTMTFVKTSDLRHNEAEPSRDDVEYAFELTRRSKKVGMLEQASLNELVTGKSTVFKINAHYEAYKNPGPNANQLGLLKWDAQLSRRDEYLRADKQWIQRYGMGLRDFQELQRKLWEPNPLIISGLFEYAT